MVCVKCGKKTAVVNSRLQKKLNTVWRRRFCNKCQLIFTTEEAIKYDLVILVKDKSNKYLPFSRDKLFLSIYKSCSHRRSAIEDSNALTNTVIARLLQEQATLTVILSKDIKQACLVTLNRFDKSVANIYQAYH